ncbi:hypothetical protein HPB48_018982 [Haemaphysalis longicornis]|uniref:Serpin domain-containing protein n=1 Tax=Haemaphysalis longicornis TaxID=44386 RepID=A0A9J6FYG2_HAELO|nr:hypothetical protein HPB48_018982 [Haemaphysalis longicornis]
MGVTDLFGSRADLSGIVAPSGGPCGAPGGISVALHRATIEVTEEGTEAAAASVSVMTRRDLHTTEFTADHPFLFLVQSNQPSPTVLFIGSVRKVDDVD